MTAASPTVSTLTTAIAVATGRNVVELFCAEGDEEPLDNHADLSHCGSDLIANELVGEDTVLLQTYGQRCDDVAVQALLVARAPTISTLDMNGCQLITGAGLSHFDGLRNLTVRP